MIDKRLKTLRNQSHKSQQDVCQAINIEQSTLANYENGKRIPKIDILIKIAQYYNVTTDYLLGIQEENTIHQLSSLNPITTRERQLVETFRQLDDDYKDIAIGEIKRLLKEQHLIETQRHEPSLKKIT